MAIGLQDFRKHILEDNHNCAQVDGGEKRCHGAGAAGTRSGSVVQHQCRAAGGNHPPEPLIGGGLLIPNLDVDGNAALMGSGEYRLRHLRPTAVTHVGDALLQWQNKPFGYGVFRSITRVRSTEFDRRKALL